MFPQ